MEVHRQICDEQYCGGQNFGLKVANKQLKYSRMKAKFNRTSIDSIKLNNNNNFEAIFW